MSAKDFYISFEIEPIVKLRCKAVTCSHNMKYRGPYCELKELMIGANGQCERYDQKVSERADDVGEDKDA